MSKIKISKGKTSTHTIRLLQPSDVRLGKSKRGVGTYPTKHYISNIEIKMFRIVKGLLH